MIIAVDAAGGEYAPREIVKGAIKAIREYNVEVALVGRKTILHVLAGRYLNKPGLTIVNASQVIGPHESPIEAVRNKLNSSIVVGTGLVRDGAASAFVSAGNTGAVVYSALFNLGKIKGIERPAIGSIININTAPVLLIDAGANANCRPSYLVQFAQLGTIYAKELFGITSPRVGLLSNGSEESKGNRLAQESYHLIKNTSLNFIGNVEGQDVSGRNVDIIVTDGFTGNIVLKTIEGLGDAFLRWRQGGGRALLYDIGLGSLFKGVDFREYGGACLLGVNGNVIIAHGRSQAKAVKNAIGLAKQVVERDITRIISEEIHE